AERAGIWANVADDTELCTFHLPSRVRRGALQLSIGSAGEAPFVVRRLRQAMERLFGPEWAPWMGGAARFRQAVRGLSLSRSEQEARYDAFFEETVDPRTFKARVLTAAEERSLLSAGMGASDPVEGGGAR
ncbi:MAG: hypothetical protein HY815_25190, partial [Candidatus Riflebacteria bacterium]|nr:hypothetical protein [Candidatus Riflebacteria bacterium]